MTWIPVACPKPAKREPQKRQGMKRTRMKKINTKRGGHAFPKNVDLDYRAFIRTQPCILGGPWRARLACDARGRFLEHRCVGRIQACHVKSRGAGGKDVGNLYPGCALAHDEQHRIGIPAFQKRWGINLAKIAAGLGLLYSEGG